MRSHRLHRLLAISLIGFVMVLGVMPSELGEAPEAQVIIINVAEPNPNPLSYGAD